jgi:hypothetical protein
MNTLKMKMVPPSIVTLLTLMIFYWQMFPAPSDHVCLCLSVPCVSQLPGVFKRWFCQSTLFLHFMLSLRCIASVLLAFWDRYNTLNNSSCHIIRTYMTATVPCPADSFTFLTFLQILTFIHLVLFPHSCKILPITLIVFHKILFIVYSSYLSEIIKKIFFKYCRFEDDCLLGYCTM